MFIPKSNVIIRRCLSSIQNAIALSVNNFIKKCAPLPTPTFSPSQFFTLKDPPFMIFCCSEVIPNFEGQNKSSSPPQVMLGKEQKIGATAHLTKFGEKL